MLFSISLLSGLFCDIDNELYFVIRNPVEYHGILDEVEHSLLLR